MKRASALKADKQKTDDSDRSDECDQAIRFDMLIGILFPAACADRRSGGTASETGLSERFRHFVPDVIYYGYHLIERDGERDVSKSDLRCRVCACDSGGVSGLTRHLDEAAHRIAYEAQQV